MYYEEVFSELNENKVRYLVVGGTALVLHGVVRLTADLDLMIALDEKNVLRFISAMEKLGYKPRVPVKASEFADPGKRAAWVRDKGMKVFSLFDPKMPIHLVDVFVYEPINFEKAYNDRKIVTADGIKIPLVSLKDLVRLKGISAREQDLADIKAIKELKKLAGNGK